MYSQPHFCFSKRTNISRKRVFQQSTQIDKLTTPSKSDNVAITKHEFPIANQYQTEMAQLKSLLNEKESCINMLENELQDLKTKNDFLKNTFECQNKISSQNVELVDKYPSVKVSFKFYHQINELRQNTNVSDTVLFKRILRNIIPKEKFLIGAKTLMKFFPNEIYAAYEFIKIKRENVQFSKLRVSLYNFGKTKNNSKSLTDASKCSNSTREDIVLELDGSNEQTDDETNFKLYLEESDTE